MRGSFGLMRRRAATVVAAAAWLTAGAAGAQVLEVHVDGSVTVYDGAHQYSSSGAHPIARVISPAGQGAKRRAAAVAPPPETAEAIHAAAERHQVDEGLVTAVAWQESGFNPRAVSPKGARGVMQLMPATAQALGVDISDQRSNIDGGADYLGQMMRRFNGDTAKALAAYNAGPGAVERYGGVPPYAETAAYVTSVMSRLNQPPQDAAVTMLLRPRMPAF